MSLFEYLGTRPDGSEAQGRIEAFDRAEAVRLLTDQGLKVRDITHVPAPASAAMNTPLTSTESEQLAENLAQFGSTGLPLEAGLRAAAAEVGNPRVASALNNLAIQLSQGIPLEDAISRPACQLPRHVGGLVAAAARTGRLGAALSELLDHQRETRSLRREVSSGFGYPLFVMCVAAVVVFFILFGLSGVFEQMFNEFEMELPYITLLLFWWRDFGIWLHLFGLCCCVGVAIVVRQAIGPAKWLRLYASMPIVGRMSYWSGLAEWTGLMSILIHHDVPLPEALRLSSSGVRNAFVGDIVKALATATEHGRSFSDALTENRHVPASLVPVIRWGERVGSLPEALSTTRELLQRRVRVRALLLKTVMPPMLFVVIVTHVAAVAIAFLLPLISLVQGLS